MKSLFVAVALVGLLAAGGCTLPEPASPAPPPGDALPPPEDLAEPGTTAPESASPESASPEGAIEESGGVVIESIEPEPDAALGPTAITIPEGKGWTQSDVPLTKQQQDIEACYNYASAQIARESQIDYDRYQVDSDFANLHGETTLTRRVDYYSERRRRGALFDACMRSKGYLKN